MKDTTPLPLISAIRRSARRKKRIYRSSRLNFLIPQPSRARRLVQVGFVWFHQALLFLGTNAGKSVVRRIAQDYQDFLVALNMLGGVAILFKLGPGHKPLLGTLWRLPAGQRVG